MSVPQSQNKATPPRMHTGTRTKHFRLKGAYFYKYGGGIHLSTKFVLILEGSWTAYGYHINKPPYILLDMHGKFQGYQFVVNVL